MSPVAEGKPLPPWLKVSVIESKMRLTTSSAFLRDCFDFSEMTFTSSDLFIGASFASLLAVWMGPPRASRAKASVTS